MVNFFVLLKKHFFCFVVAMFDLVHDMEAIHCHLSRVMRKAMFFICEIKDADQLRGNLFSAIVFAT